MEKIVIHIGYHKSASTFLQNTVFPQLPVNYLFFAGPDRLFLNMVESKNDLDIDAIRSWAAGEISSNRQQNKGEITILSHEELSGHPHGYKTISPFITAQNLARTFPGAKIVVLIRNQPDYITSLYTYRVAVKGYETRNFNRFIAEESAKGLTEHLEYHLLIEHYQELFGHSKVLVLPMELLTKSPDELFKKFFDFIQIPHQKINFAKPVNESTKSVFILSLWRPINFFFRLLLNTLNSIRRIKSGNGSYERLRYRFYKLKRIITGLLNRTFLAGKKINIKECPEYLKILERFEESNARLQEITGLDLAAFGYPIKKSDSIHHKANMA